MKGDKLTLISVLLYNIQHRNGKIKFLDKDNVVFQMVDVKDVANISPAFYNCEVKYKQHIPVENAYYSDDIVATVCFTNRAINQLKRLKAGD